MDICLSPARAAASRRNGAKSCGPKTSEGKARSSRNALRHGLRAQKHIVLPGESAAAFETFEADLLEELAPEGALQTVLARRVVTAAWRLERAERIEVQLFAWNQLHGGGRSLGLALIRDCNDARAFDTLLRYRGGTLAELWRALRTLKALQAEAAPQAEQARAAAAPQAEIRRADSRPAPARTPASPIEPEARTKPGDSGREDDRAGPQAGPAPARLPHRPRPTADEAACVRPIEPESREPAGAAPQLAPEIKRVGNPLLAGTALVPLDRRSWP